MSKRLYDRYGDEFEVRTIGDEIIMGDPTGGEIPIVDLAFEPLGALRLARVLTKAAERALKNQERDASSK